MNGSSTEHSRKLFHIGIPTTGFHPGPVRNGPFEDET